MHTHHTHTGQSGSLREKRLIHFDTPESPNISDKDAVEAPRPKPKFGNPDSMADEFDEVFKSGKKKLNEKEKINRSSEPLKLNPINTAEELKSEMQRMGSKLLALVMTIYKFAQDTSKSKGNSSAKTAIEAISQMPNLMGLATRASLFNQAEKEGIVRHGNVTNTISSISEVTRVNEDALLQNIDDAKQNYNEFTTDRGRILRTYNQLAGGRRLSAQQYDERTDAMRSLRSAKGNPTERFWNAVRTYENATGKSYVRLNRARRGESLPPLREGVNARAKAFKYAFIDAGSGRTVGTYDEWTANRSGTMDTQTMADLIAKNPRRGANSRGFIEIVIDGSAYMPREISSNGYAGGGGAPMNSLLHKAYVNRGQPNNNYAGQIARFNNAARHGVRLGQRPLSYNDVAVGDHIDRAVGRGRNILPGSHNRYIAMANPRIIIDPTRRAVFRTLYSR